MTEISSAPPKICKTNFILNLQSLCCSNNKFCYLIIFSFLTAKFFTIFLQRGKLEVFSSVCLNITTNYSLLIFNYQALSNQVDIACVPNFTQHVQHWKSKKEQNNRKTCFLRLLGLVWFGLKQALHIQHIHISVIIFG